MPVYKYKTLEEKLEGKRAAKRRYRERNKHKARAYYLKRKSQGFYNTPELMEKNRQRSTIYSIKNRELINLRYREKYKENSEFFKEKSILKAKKYRAKNRIRDNIRYQNDICFRLKKHLRSRLRKSLKTNAKKGSAVKLLGCTIEEFKLYLEKQFTNGMTWDNYGCLIGCWNIDHIIPLSRVDLTNIEDLKKVCHYTNLRPMWAQENYSKGNKI